MRVPLLEDAGIRSLIPALHCLFQTLSISAVVAYVTALVRITKGHQLQSITQPRLNSTEPLTFVECATVVKMVATPDGRICASRVGKMTGSDVSFGMMVCTCCYLRKKVEGPRCSLREGGRCCFTNYRRARLFIVRVHV